MRQYVRQHFGFTRTLNDDQHQYGAPHWTIEGELYFLSTICTNILTLAQELLSAKGLESTWDQLGDISAAIDYLNKI